MKRWKYLPGGTTKGCAACGVETEKLGGVTGPVRFEFRAKTAFHTLIDDDRLQAIVLRDCLYSGLLSLLYTVWCDIIEKRS